MSDKLTGTQTEKNLEKALQGEALAHLKYQFYRSQLAKYNKGYEKQLDEIIHNEKEHGKIWFKKLHNGEVPDNLINLLDAIEGETYEHTEMYPHFAEIAEEEGFKDISVLFREVAVIEGNHSREFQSIREEIEKDYYNEDCYWKCSNCGHIIKSIDGFAPMECPVCNHPRKYFTKIL